jgi:hypothetical protein
VFLVSKYLTLLRDINSHRNFTVANTRGACDRSAVELVEAAFVANFVSFLFMLILCSHQFHFHSFCNNL